MQMREAFSSLIELLVLENTFRIIIKVPVQFELAKTSANKRMLIIFLRLLTRSDGKQLLTFQAIADLLYYPDRRNVNNYWRDFIELKGDFLAYLSRKVDFKKLIPLMESYVVNNLHLTISDLYKGFTMQYKVELCFSTFCKYLSEINALSVIKGTAKLNRERVKVGDTNHLLEMLSSVTNIPVTCEKLLEEIRGSRSEKSTGKAFSSLNLSRKHLCLLVHYLVGSGMNLKTIATLLNVSKSTVSNLWHEIEGFQALLINSIGKWSGKIAIDEKYVKINSIVHYVISIVDYVTGLPLFIDIYPDTKKESYEACFRTFKLIYKKDPVLIVSDGSKALAAARQTVFPKVHYQLCKFHKIRNLFKRINTLKISETEKKHLKKIVINAFRRKTVSGRKKGLRSKILNKYSYIAEYILSNILKEWRHLSKGLTSNVSERFNRKLEKILSGKYGLKSVATTRNLIMSLWFKELVEKGKPILNQNSIISDLNIAQICQEKVAWKELTHSFSICNDKAA